MTKTTIRVVAFIITVVMILGVLPTTMLAAELEATNGVIYENGKFGYNGYYNVISRKDYVLVPGAAVEYEMVLNNDAGSRRQVLHVIEVDPSNPDVSIVPGYNQIDKLAVNPTNEAYWSHKELTEMAKYYEDNLGYNIVGGMNTDLYYDTYAPRILVYNGKDIGVKGKTSPSSSILYVFKEADGTISCDVKAFNRADFDSYLASGRLLHAVSVSFGMVVKDGKLVKTAEVRESSGDAARSMVGVKADGTLVICMNDGRGANNSEGLSGEFEEGEVMLALGCQWAANCDGGGSSTFLTKRVGEDDFTMRSVPCDGAQRPTAHGIFVASNVAPTGILNNVNVESEYDIFAPNTVYTFGAEAIDTHGYAMNMPADASWALSNASFGTISNGKFVSNGTAGSVDVQIISGGQVVGTKTITVADPEVFKLSATSTVIPYTTADKVRTISLPIVAMTGEANVYVDTNAVSVKLSNAAAGILDGFKFTATDDTTITGVDVIIGYGGTVLTYAIEFGKGSEIVFDFEDGDISDFMGFDEAKQWNIDNGIENTLTSSEPIGGQFSENVDGHSFLATKENGGQVRNGQCALGFKLDNTDANFANWTYNIIYYVGGPKVLRDVANGQKATSFGMWVYIPEGAAGLAMQLTVYKGTSKETATTGTQLHFYFTSASGQNTNLNSAKEEDIPESRWVYASVALTDNYVSLVDPTKNQYREPTFIRTYIKPTSPMVHTFYFDDFTLDYSSAVDDRVLPTITAPTYSTSDTAVSLENGTAVVGEKFAFSATVTDNAALDLTSGKIFVDGVEIKAAIAGSTLSTKEDVTLVAGTHTVVFEVKDELGNPARLTRTFTVVGLAEIALSGHNDSYTVPQAQSIYYVDIKVANIAKVNKLVAQIKLNNANTWETKGAVVAKGFKATFSYNEISELLTVIVERVGVDGKTFNNTLVSIPVRVWTYDAYDSVNGKYLDPADMGNKPVVNVMAEIVYGVVDGKSFSGAINVATELTTISSPYHVHDEVLTVLNKVATAEEKGYENRTYCETCKSVVDWGTIKDKIFTNHQYEIYNGQFVCMAQHNGEDCFVVYLSGTGIFEMYGELYYSINNVLKTGWQSADNGYCYASTSTYKVYAGISKVIGRGIYTFDENGILQGGAWVTTDRGTVYSYGPACYTRTWAQIDGKTYYFGRDSYMYTGIRFVKDNPDVPPVWYDFGTDGATDKNVHPADGVYEVNGDYYVVKDGITQSGLHYVNGAYYLGGIGSGFDRAGACAKERSYKVSADMTNGLLPAGTYYFDSEAKMVLMNGLVEEGGKLYYYENGTRVKKGAVKVGDDIYYFSMKYYALDDGKYFITADMTNGLFPEGYYVIKDYKVQMKNGIFEENGKLYYYENNEKVRAGAVNVDGEIYYFSMKYYALADGQYYITADMANGLIPEGYYTIKDYKVQMKNGLYEEGGKLYYYENNVKQKAGAVQVGMDLYYFSMRYYALEDGKYYITADMTNGLIPEGYYTIKDYKIQVKNGPVEEDGKLYYYLNNVKQKAGAVKVGDDIYYFSMKYYALEDGKYYITEDMTNGLFPAGYYEIKDYKVVLKNGMYEENGKLYYYINNVKQKAGAVKIGDDIYYFSMNYYALADGRYYILADMMNGLLPEGYYYIKDHKIVVS